MLLEKMINVQNDKKCVMNSWNPQTLDKSKIHELCDYVMMSLKPQILDKFKTHLNIKHAQIKKVCGCFLGLRSFNDLKRSLICE